jgi:uncharacterized protein YdeI (BOF family)
MKKIILAIVATFALSAVAFADDHGAAAPAANTTAPAAETAKAEAPAKGAKKAKKVKKMKGEKKAEGHAEGAEGHAH